MKVNIADLEDSSFYQVSQGLKAMTPSVLGYENNFSQNQADECRSVYLHYYRMIRTVSMALKMGVTELTLTTATGPVAVPLLDKSVALQIGNELQEMLGDKLGELERAILNYEEEAIQEEKDRLGSSDRAQMLSHCISPTRRLGDAEFNALPAEAQRAYNHYGTAPRLTDEELARQSKGGHAA